MVLAFLLAAASWQPWAPRAEIAPRTAMDGDTLVIEAAQVAGAWGGWERTVTGVNGGKWYRLTALYRTESVPHPSLQTGARIDWVSTSGRRAGQPDYAWERSEAEGWSRVNLLVPAPAEAAAAKVQLYLGNGATGRVLWKDVRFEPADDPGPRPVRVAAINLRPAKTSGPEDSVARFLEAIDATVTRPVDLIVLPEGITVVGTGKKYADVAEPLPGPTVRSLAESAKKHRAWIVAGLYEREGSVIYNTAVLIDREGRLAGKYRKVYLPREEVEGGITPGSSYPVFATDFGKLGMMICWDVHYADPARNLALNGAEVIAMPIWGGNETLAKARAIENRVFIAASGYDFPTQVLDPDGNVVASARSAGTAAVGVLDLNRRYLDPWLGDMKQRIRKELRVDVPPALP